MSATITSVIALCTALAASIPQIMKVLADRKRGIRESELQKSKHILVKQYSEEITRLHKRITELEAELDEE